MKNKRTSDFGTDSGSETIVLKEKTWRFELSRSKAVRFLRKHKIAVVGILALLCALIVTHYALVGLASTADFYPSSCLGNWENVQNALGKPDLPSGSPASAFTPINSAVFGTSTAQMFCGNFSGDTDIATLSGESFQSADLVLSWSFVFPQEASTTSTSTPDSGGGGGGGSGGADGNTVTSGVATSSSVTSTLSDDASSTVSSTIIIASSTSSSTITASSTVIASSTISASSTVATSSTVAASSTTGASSTQDDIATSSPSTTPTSSVSSSTDDQTTSTPNDDVATDTTVAAPPPSSNDSSTPADASGTSWLWKFVGIAYADEETSSLATAATTSELADSTSTLTVTSSEAIGTPTTSTPSSTPIDVDTSIFQNITLPSSTGDAVLAIVYSTDGVTWQPLVNIDSSNWQQARYPIPISSWQELEHLQIAFAGLGASSSPQIFLDSAGVEVSYADVSAGTTDPAVASDTQNTSEITDVSPVAPTPSGPTIPAPPPAPVELPPAQAFKAVFDPFAQQQCSVTPFSESITAGGSGSFLLKLTPPAVATSSKNTSSSTNSSKTAFLYDASLGSVPDGITANIATESPGVDTIGINASAEVAPGSYNMVVVYNERQHDGTVEPNFCQLNVIVTGPSS